MSDDKQTAQNVINSATAAAGGIPKEVIDAANPKEAIPDPPKEKIPDDEPHGHNPLGAFR